VDAVAGGRRGAARTVDIQFDVADALAPVRRIDRVVVRCSPVYTTFTTLALRRRPTVDDQRRLDAALRAVERAIRRRHAVCS
jgi:hypothetical protein